MRLHELCSMPPALFHGCIGCLQGGLRIGLGLLLPLYGGKKPVTVSQDCSVVGEVLLQEVWGYRHAADTRLVNVHVQRLRSKVEHDPENPVYVLTIRGIGYKAGPA